MLSTWEKAASQHSEDVDSTFNYPVLQGQSEVSGWPNSSPSPLPQSLEQDSVVKMAGTFSWNREGGRSSCRGLGEEEGAA